MILVSGATGHLGKEVVAQLLRQGAKGEFAVLARDAAKAQIWADQGIEVRVADFDQPETLATAFVGIEKFLLISTMSMERGAQQIAVVDAAAAAGVKHIFYTGLAIRDIATSAVQSLMQSHFDTEAHIRASGMDFTFLRNTMYAEALLQILGPNALQTGIFLPGGAGRVPYATRAEMGEAAANALLGTDHQGKSYTLTASQSWDYAEIADGLSRLTGKALPYIEIPDAALAEGLKAAGLPDFMIWLTRGTIQDIREGQYDIPSDDLKTLLGRAPKGRDAFLTDTFASESLTMTRTSRAVVDAMFTAFNAKDLTAALATVSDDTLWIHHGSQKMPSVRFEGKSGAEKFFQTSFHAMKIDYFRPLTFIEQGDTVVVIGEESYVMDGIEGQLTNKWVQIYTTRDGLITKMEEFATSADADAYMVVQ